MLNGKKIEILKDFIKYPNNINNFEEAEELLLLADELYKVTIHDYQILKIKIDKGFDQGSSILEIKVKTDEVVDLVKSVITCINSRFYQEMKNRFGDKVAQAYTDTEIGVYSDGAVLKNLIKEEQLLVDDYFSILNSIQGKDYNSSKDIISSEPYLSNSHLGIAKSNSLNIENNYNEITEIYTKLVSTRNEIAKAKGFLNYYDYQISKQKKDKDKISLFIDDMKNSFLTFLPSFLEERDSNLSQSMPPQLFHFYFLNHESKEMPNRKDIRKILKEIDAELFEMFNVLDDEGKLDFSKSKTKRNIAYTTYLYDEKLPYIFMQDRGGFSDLRVITHELGHAFEKYLNKDVELFLQFTSNIQTAESQAITMELIFAEQQNILIKSKSSNDYKNYIILKNLILIPEALCIYEFERLTYSSKSLEKKDLKRIWIDLNIKFGLLKESSLNEQKFSEYWVMKKHLFNAPGYYINYAIAKLVAFQFYSDYVKDKASTFISFKKYIKSSGCKSFEDLLISLNLFHPFSKESLAFVDELLKKHLVLYKKNTTVN